MRLSVVIPHFWTERVANLPRIVDALCNAIDPPDEILIWNNTEHPVEWVMNDPAVFVINSPRNIGPKARFLAALLARGDTILFHDNDLVVQPITLTNLRNWYEALNNRQGFEPTVIALEGRQIIPGRSYGANPVVFGRDVRLATTIDITLGRLEMVPRFVVEATLGIIPFSDALVMDDLYFSAALRRLCISACVVPCGDGADFVNIDDGVGMCQTPTHYAERDTIMKQLFGEPSNER